MELIEGSMKHVIKESETKVLISPSYSFPKKQKTHHLGTWGNRHRAREVNIKKVYTQGTRMDVQER